MRARKGKPTYAVRLRDVLRLRHAPLALVPGAVPGHDGASSTKASMPSTIGRLYIMTFVPYDAVFADFVPHECKGWTRGRVLTLASRMLQTSKVPLSFSVRSYIGNNDGFVVCGTTGVSPRQ